MHEMIFMARNRHIDSCGTPPCLSTLTNCFVSYFENELGEQMIFTHMKGERTGRLYSGDHGWLNVVKIPPEGIRGDMYALTEPELHWIEACQMVLRRRLSSQGGDHT